MVFVEMPKGFRGNDVGFTLASFNNCGLKPILFDPVEDLFLANAQGTGNALQREDVTANLANARSMTLKHIPYRFGTSIELSRNLVNRVLSQLLPHHFNLGISPASMLNPVLDSELDDEPPAFFP
jgi:hypothetical protein